MCASCFVLYFPVTCNPSREVTLPNIGVPHYMGVPHRVTYPYPLRYSGDSLMQSASEAGSYLRLMDSCITRLKAQGPSRTCNESKEEEEGERTALIWTRLTKLFTLHLSSPLNYLKFMLKPFQRAKHTKCGGLAMLSNVRFSHILKRGGFIQKCAAVPRRARI